MLSLGLGLSLSLDVTARFLSQNGNVRDPAPHTKVSVFVFLFLPVQRLLLGFSGMQEDVSIVVFSNVIVSWCWCASVDAHRMHLINALSQMAQIRSNLSHFQRLQN